MATPAVLPPTGSAATFRSVLLRRHGGPTADRVLRGAAVVSVTLLAVSLIVPPAVPLVVFMAFTLWTNGPYSPVLPASYEPVLMLFGRLYPPVLIAVLGTIGTVLMEYVNYEIYAAGADRLPAGVRESAWLERTKRWYARAPFATIVVAAATPIPYWLVRILSAVSRYSVRRHLAGTALGRFPRLWFFAAIGTTLGVPTRWLVVVTVGMVAAVTLIALGRLRGRWRIFRRGTPAAALLSPSPENPPCCS